MPSRKKKGFLQIIDDIKSKTLSQEELIKKIKELGKIGNKLLADDLIPLLDKFDDEELLFHFRETFAKLGITAQFINDAGLKKENEEDYDGAIQKFKLALKLDPDHYWAYYNLARMYDKKGDSNKAIEFHKKALLINKNYGESWNSLGTIYYDLNQLNLAKQAYEKAIHVQYRSKHLPYYNIGLIYEKKDNLNKALEYFLKSVESKRTYAKSSYNAGRVLRNLGEHEKASKYFAMALRYDQTYEQTIRKLGVKVEEIMAVQILKKLDTFKLKEKGKS